MKEALFTKDLLKSLSPLEARIISTMKTAGGYTAAEFYSLLSKEVPVAKSSISVALDRLYKKGLLARETETTRGGIRFIYRLETSRERFERNVVESAVNALLKRFGTKAIAYFNESLTKESKR